jgi:hypothetical protein
MNRVTARALKVALVVSLAAGIAASASSEVRALVLDIYVLCIGGVLLLALVRVTRARAPAGRDSQFDAALAAMRRVPPDTGEPALIRDIELSTYSAFHLHTRVRPVLRDIAAHRLRTRYGVELDAEPVRARELLGTAIWDVVRPDRPPPRDRLAPGPNVRQLRTLVQELEAI